MTSGEFNKDEAENQQFPHVTNEMIWSRIVNTEFMVWGGTTLTICKITLNNGFSVLGEHQCASFENFDVLAGRRAAQKNAIDKLYPLFGFLLLEKLFREKNADVWPPIEIIAEPYKIRRMQEKRVLDERLKKYQATFDDKYFWGLPSNKQELFFQHYELMIKLSGVLDKIIDACDDDHCPSEPGEPDDDDQGIDGIDMPEMSA